MEKYLVINAGSSSLKFSMYEMPTEKLLINGYFEKIGLDDCFWSVKIDGERIERVGYLANHSDAVKEMINELKINGIIESMDEISGVGHRVLHGGELYSESVTITDKVLDDIINLTKLGPLHHPGQIAGIKAMMEVLPNVNQIAVFDTAFHQTMPECNYMYAVPYSWYQDYKVRRYGFHGTSHKYLTEYMKKELGRDDVNLIICHVGSGASISCIKNGLCFMTSMGLTPLDGLVMGTRSGNIDASILEFVMNETGMSIEDITNQLNKNSGLLGICGKSDFRDMLALKMSGDKRANLAYDMYRDSIIKIIAEYYFKLEGNLDAIVFTAGVLENNSFIREDLVSKMSKVLGININKDINENIGVGKELRTGIITTNDSKVSVYVVPTNEEVMILRDTYNIINK